VLFAGAVVIALSVFATGGISPFEFGLFLFSLLPLIVFALLVARFGSDRLRWRYVATVVFFALLISAYGAAAVEVETSTSSTAGLIYLFLPFYMLLAAVGSVLLASVVGRIWDLARARSRQSH
jgi:FlaA1/EpsC-like NDP-sugar epimerase